MASSLQVNFSKYYLKIMPDLKNIIKSVKPDTQAKIDIRVMTIETIGYFIKAISKNTSLFN